VIATEVLAAEVRPMLSQGDELLLGIGVSICCAIATLWGGAKRNFREFVRVRSEIPILI
jgi:hypothetical protein